MQVVALRGVCVGPGHHLVAGEVAEVDPATAQFLKSISAVKDHVPAADPISEPVKAGKKEK